MRPERSGALVSPSALSAGWRAVGLIPPPRFECAAAPPARHSSRPPGGPGEASERFLPGVREPGDGGTWTTPLEGPDGAPGTSPWLRHPPGGRPGGGQTAFWGSWRRRFAPPRNADGRHRKSPGQRLARDAAVRMKPIAGLPGPARPAAPQARPERRPRAGLGHVPSRNRQRGQTGPASWVKIVVAQRGHVHRRGGSQDHGQIIRTPPTRRRAGGTVAGPPATARPAPGSPGARASRTPSRPSVAMSSPTTRPPSG
jgi:hypothetical protein